MRVVLRKYLEGKSTSRRFSECRSVAFEFVFDSLSTLVSHRTRSPHHPSPKQTGRSMTPKPRDAGVNESGIIGAYALAVPPQVAIAILQSCAAAQLSDR